MTNKDTSDEGTAAKPWSVGQSLTDFSQSTSMHGIANVGDSNKRCLSRLFWLLLVLLAAGWSTYNVTEIIISYMKSPVSTVVSIEYEENIPFPAITICNLNQIRRSAKFVEDLLDDLKPSSDSDTTAENGTLESELLRSLEAEFESAYEFSTGLRSYLDRLTLKQRYELGHQIQDMLISCNYQQSNCSLRNFSVFWNHEYGNCYTFNRDVQADTVSKSGPVHGLSLLLNVESDDYLGYSETVGLKVDVHHPHAMPFPDDEGIVVSPGFATSVGIRRVDIKRTPQPYGRCYDYTKEENRLVNMYAERFNVDYTDKRKTIESCHCCDPDYPCIIKIGLPAGLTNVTYCNASSNTDVICLDVLRTSLRTGTSDCKTKCLPACSEVLYQTEVSMGVWPSEHSLGRLTKQFKKFPNFSLNDSLPIGKRQELLRKQVAKVDIFFKQLNYEHLQTRPAYTVHSLLSDLGGQMGLWLGFSFLTAVELLGLLMELLRHSLLKLLNRKWGK